MTHPDYLALAWAGTKRHLTADLADFTAVLRARLQADLEQRHLDAVNRGVAQQQRVSREEFRAAVEAVLSEQYPPPKTRGKRTR